MTKTAPIWRVDRQRRIGELVAKSGRVSCGVLVRTLGVSDETVRRDLMELETAGVLKRVHGGAVALEFRAEAPFNDRLNARRREKIAIAQAAARLVRPGQICFVDAGSTTTLLAPELALVEDITVLTNSPEVAQVFRTHAFSGHMFVLGGAMLPDIPGLTGEMTLNHISRFMADVALLSPVGLDPENGATNFMFQEAEIARAMIAHSRSVIMLADSSKIGETSRVSICPCRQISTLVTDSGARPGDVAALKAAGIETVIVA